VGAGKEKVGLCGARIFANVFLPTPFGPANDVESHPAPILPDGNRRRAPKPDSQFTPHLELMPRILTSFDAIISAWSFMRTTLALDDDLIRIAQEFTGVAEKTALVREALKALIERESARRLASMGGTMPALKNVPRRRARPL
jgi:Arc/MetJ family transcription regulator